jgi:hypothetical protein
MEIRMVEVRERSFGKEDVQTDGETFVGCIFEGTTLRYGGGPHPRFERCTLTGVNWHFNDAALRTIQFLQGINASDGGPAFIGDLFRPGVYISE